MADKTIQDVNDRIEKVKDDFEFWWQSEGTYIKPTGNDTLKQVCNEAWLKGAISYLDSKGANDDN